MSFPRLKKVLLNNIDVSNHIINYETIDVYDDSIGTAKIVVSRSINSVLPITRDDSVGWSVFISRGIDNADEEIIFRGEILDVETEGGRYILNCANRYYEAVRNEVTTSFDINIDEEQGVGSEIFKTLINRYTTLSADNLSVQNTGTDLLIKKFSCVNADVFERVSKIAEAYNWQHYYDNEKDKVFFEPRGFLTETSVLQTGVNVIKKPQWKYSKEKMINELTLKGAEQTVEKSIFLNGTNANGQIVVLPQTPISVKVYVGSGNFTPSSGTKPSNNENNLKIGGKVGSTSGTFDYEYDDDPKVKTIYFYDSARGTQPSFTPPIGTNNIEIQFSYNLPTPVIDSRPASIEKYGLHKKTHVRSDIKNISDGELYVQTTLDFFSKPFISTVLNVSYVKNLKIGRKYRVIDDFENIDDYFIITKIKKVYPYIADEVTVGNEVLIVSAWETKTMDRIKRLEEIQSQNQDLLLHIKKSVRTRIAEKRYFKLTNRNVAGESGIYGHPIFGVYGTAKYGAEFLSNFVLGHPKFGVLGKMTLGEAERQEWRTVKLIQGKNTYKELVYDDLFYDSSASSGVTWDNVNNTITISAGGYLITKLLFLGIPYNFATVNYNSTNTVICEISTNNGNFYQTLAKNVRTPLVVNSSKGVLLKITATTETVISNITNVFGELITPAITLKMEE